MREESFKIWMQNLGTMGPRPIGDAISRCRRVKNGLGIDLMMNTQKTVGAASLTCWSTPQTMPEAIARYHKDLVLLPELT